MQNFASLKTWPYSKDVQEKNHVLKNANFCIPGKIKNFTQNDFANLLLVCTTTYRVACLLLSKCLSVNLYRHPLCKYTPFTIVSFSQSRAAKCWQLDD